MSSGEHARAVRLRLVDPFDVARKLNLLGKGAFVRSGNGVLVLCPWHGEHHPSCSVTRGRDGTIRVRCFSCEATGDVLDLVAAVRGIDTRNRFIEVLCEAAALAGMFDVVEALESGQRPERPVRVFAPPPPPEPVEDRDYPPADEIRSVWDSAGLVLDDVQVCAYLRGRGFAPEKVELFRLARVIRPDASLPAWARFRGVPWSGTGHRLIMQACDATGRCRSLRAWRISDGESPKRLPPAGYRASGLILADAAGRFLLGGNPWPYSKVRVVIAEGEPDWLHWATWYSDAVEVPAVLGLVSGGWTAEHASRIPDGAEIVLWMHDDASGARYAEHVRASFKGRNVVLLRANPNARVA